MNIVAIFRKQSLSSQSIISSQSRILHGKQAWAEVQGQPGRVLVYFNKLLWKPNEVDPKNFDSAWLSCWGSLDNLRATPRPVPTDPEEISRQHHKDICKARALARQFRPVSLTPDVGVSVPAFVVSTTA